VIRRLSWAVTALRSNASVDGQASARFRFLRFCPLLYPEPCGAQPILLAVYASAVPGDEDAP
jgi:hypothetical protein